MICWLVICLSVAVAVPASAAQVATFSAVVEATTGDRAATPVCAEVRLPQDIVSAGGLVASVRPTNDPDQLMPAQVELRDGKARVWWIVGKCEAGKQIEYRVFIRAGSEERPSFSFEDTLGHHLDCLFDGRPVTRLMYFTYDPGKHEETKKVYHHVFDSTGQRLITKGSGGKYPHHRGLFIGWNRTTIGNRVLDFWHMPKPEVSQRHAGFIEQIAGPVFARETSRVNWCDAEGKPVIEEERTLTVFRQDSPAILLEWSAELRSVVGEVFLNGDMHHAGFQYRAANEVSEREDETYYLHPREGVQRPSGPKIPWSAMSYALGESRFTVAHMNHPDNPRPTDYSDEERRYGRFGAFFTYRLGADQTLSPRYRLYIVEGDPPALEQIDARYLDFVAPPRVIVRGL